MSAGDRGRFDGTELEQAEARIKELEDALHAIRIVEPYSGTSRLEINDWADALDKTRRIADNVLGDDEDPE